MRDLTTQNVPKSLVLGVLHFTRDRDSAQGLMRPPARAQGPLPGGRARLRRHTPRSPWAPAREAPPDDGLAAFQSPGQHTPQAPTTPQDDTSPGSGLVLGVASPYGVRWAARPEPVPGPREHTRPGTGRPPLHIRGTRGQKRLRKQRVHPIAAGRAPSATRGTLPALR